MRKKSFMSSFLNRKCLSHKATFNCLINSIKPKMVFVYEHKVSFNKDLLRKK